MKHTEQPGKIRNETNLQFIFCSPVREEHLDLLVVAGQVALGVVALVGVLLAPLESARRQLVRRQRARTEID